MLEGRPQGLWRRIGVNEATEPEGENEERSRTNSSSACSLPRKERPFRGRLDFDGTTDREQANRDDPYSKEEELKLEVVTPVSISVLEQPPFAPPSMPIRRSEQTWHEGQLLIAQEESRLQMGARREGSVRSGGSELEDYNLQLSEMPQSVTPLVYSKASRKEDVRFRKQTAKAILLKIRLAEAKDHLQRLKGEFLNFSGMIREEHQGLQKEICAKYFQMQREQSVRVQESVFMHKQDYQQLRYQLQVIRGKEDLLRYPVDSELILNSSHNHLKQEKQEFAIQLANFQKKCSLLEEDNKRLASEEIAFKKQMGEIEAKTMEIRLSNDKLYEYIFDLEQKVAYYQQQIPKISQRAQENIQQQFNREMEQQAAAHYAQINRYSQQIGLLQTQGTRLEEEMKKSNELIVQFQKDNAQLRLKLEKILQELKAIQQKSQTKQKENSILDSENKKLKSEIQRLMKEREDMEQWKEEQRRESTSRLSRAFSNKQDKKLLQTLEIQKIVLQKENIQLKATIEFQSKNIPYSPSYLPQKTFPLQYDPPNIQPLQHTEQKEMLEMKQRELISLQNYLQDQARRLQNKQRDIDSEYIIKKAQQTRIRDYAQQAPVRINTIDDYGMKKLPVTHSKVTQQPRRNNFCSSQTQAIIEKVKMRQRMKENGCICNQPRNCHCDVHSRGSRTSQDSNSRDYLRMQQHRPSDYSPGMRNYDYTRREDKSSKMKLIEDKVRRLKSELKSSFTTLNSS